MKYAIYFTWLDGTEDSYNVDTAKYRDMTVDEMLVRKSFKYIAYKPIYKSGEYGKRKVVYENANLLNELKEQVLDTGVTPQQLKKFEKLMLVGNSYESALEQTFDPNNIFC